MRLRTNDNLRPLRDVQLFLVGQTFPAFPKSKDTKLGNFNKQVQKLNLKEKQVALSAHDYEYIHVQRL